MIIARTKGNSGNICKDLFTKEQFHIWEKNFNIIDSIELTFSGKSYREKKENLRILAIETQYFLSSDCNVDLSYGEIADIQNFFETAGRRYGLLREFRENAIC